MAFRKKDSLKKYEKKMKKIIEDIFPVMKPFIFAEDISRPHMESKNYYEWYYTYGDFYKPKTILEIGTRCAYSAIAVALGSKQVEKIVMIDNESSGVPL